jgi:DNA polymerase III delta prime subunit
MIKTTWDKLEEVFPDIIRGNERYRLILENILLSSNNKLLYTPIGFPIDTFLNLLLVRLCNIQAPFNKTEHIWEKSISYVENQHYIEIDLMNPDNMKNIEKITPFLLHIISSKNVKMKKHLIVIKHIDLLSSLYCDFRIILEKYSQNVVFVCTTHFITRIEAPIKSRFSRFRIPLFTFNEICDIFTNNLDISMNDYLLETKTRNIIKAIFIAELERQPAGGAEILTKEFVEFNYPPFVEFIRTYNKNKNNLEEIRGLSYKCCQYNISILQITQDFVRLVDYDNCYLNIKDAAAAAKNDLKCEIIKIGTEIDYLLSQTNKCKEPLYIENLLCQLLL